MAGNDLEFEKIKTILSDNLKSHRKNNNLSQEELAEISGLHRTYIGSVERKERNVTLSTLALISSALQTTVIELLSEKGSNGKK